MRVNGQALTEPATEKLLTERLQSEHQKGQADFESLLSRVHGRMTAADPAGIEADITTAMRTTVCAARRSEKRHQGLGGSLPL